MSRVAVLLIAAGVLPAAAELVRLEVKEQGAVAGGYERVVATGHFAIDPKTPQNRRITDIELAPRNAQGKVEFSADIHILRPADRSAGNGTILFQVPNRGGKDMVALFNRAKASLDPKTEAELGDGLLGRAGYTLLWIGWQHDVPRKPGLMRLHPPVASGVSGWVHGEYTPDSPGNAIPLADAGHVPYPVADASKAWATFRRTPDSQPEPLPASEWKIEGEAIVTTRPLTPGWTYQFAYPSSGPAVAGTGLAAIRDTISWLKQNEGYKHAIGFGVSQSAMLLRALLYEGFNLDEKNRRVLDGVMAHVAGGRRSVFPRFAQPSRTAGPLRQGTWSGTDQFPFADLPQVDPVTKQRAGVLDPYRAKGAAHGVPKIFYTNSSYEYWGSGASLLHTGVDGKRDAAIPETTRIYLLSGGQHGPAGFPPSRGNGQYLANHNDYKWALRALLGAMQLWVEKGTAPPPSLYPRLSDGTLVEAAKVNAPAGVKLPDPYRVRRLVPASGAEAAQFGAPFEVRVARTAPDGNETSGLRMPAVAVPVGAYTGWNPRNDSAGAAGFLLANTGSFIPFSSAELQQKYGGRDPYLSKVRTAAEELAGRGYLLKADLDAIVSQAGQTWDFIAGRATASR